MQSSATIGQADVEQEYLTVKNKVEGRIRELQSRLTPAHSNHNSHLTTPRAYHKSHHSCHHHSCHHSHHHCGHLTSHSPATQVQQSSQFHHQNDFSKSQHVSNDLMGEALLQSIRGQQMIQENIQALANRIEILSTQQLQSSGMSEMCSSTKRRKTPLFNDFLSPRNFDSSQEQPQEYLLPAPVDQKTPTRKNPLKRVKSGKVKQKKEKSKAKNSLNKTKMSKSKSKNHTQSEYFLSRGCPIHSPQQTWSKIGHAGEIYKDAQHRNRKHERDHLLSSFEQQSRSRRRLISKIDLKAFQQYGIK